MKRNVIRTLIALLAFLLCSGFAIAAESKIAASGEAAGTAKPSGASATKAVTPAKPVDINSATKAQLKKLPGIGDEQADKIIAGRPYGSKAWLVTHNVISGVHYEQIKDLIIARQK